MNEYLFENRVELEVCPTPDEMQRGFPGSASQCPIALAVRRLLNVPEGHNVTVGYSGVRMFEMSGKYRQAIATLPLEAAAFVREFDARPEDEQLLAEWTPPVPKPFKLVFEPDTGE